MIIEQPGPGVRWARPVARSAAPARGALDHLAEAG